MTTMSFTHRLDDYLGHVRDQWWQATSALIAAFAAGQPPHPDTLTVAVHAAYLDASWTRVVIHIENGRHPSDAVLEVRSDATRHLLDHHDASGARGGLFAHAMAEAARTATHQFLADSADLILNHHQEK